MNIVRVHGRPHEKQVRHDGGPRARQDREHRACAMVNIALGKIVNIVGGKITAKQLIPQCSPTFLHLEGVFRRQGVHTGSFGFALVHHCVR